MQILHRSHRGYCSVWCNDCCSAALLTIFYPLPKLPWNPFTPVHIPFQQHTTPFPRLRSGSRVCPFAHASTHMTTVRGFISSFSIAITNMKSSGHLPSRQPIVDHRGTCDLVLGFSSYLYLNASNILNRKALSFKQKVILPVVRGYRIRLLYQLGVELLALLHYLESRGEQRWNSPAPALARLLKDNNKKSLEIWVTGSIFGLLSCCIQSRDVLFSGSFFCSLSVGIYASINSKT